MDWAVPFVNYPKQFRAMEAEIMSTVREVLGRGDLMLRGQLRDFETHFAAFVGTRFAVGAVTAPTVSSWRSVPPGSAPATR
jgi:dTDP-4-amino-4,6-dideoxygalactose transaminase